MEKLIQQAHDRGCTFFDTAEGYSAGSNEELLGRAVAPFRDKVIIGTKFTVDLTKNPPINDNQSGSAACEGSLRRLKTDVIDLCHQHRIDRSVPDRRRRRGRGGPDQGRQGSPLRLERSRRRHHSAGAPRLPDHGSKRISPDVPQA